MSHSHHKGKGLGKPSTAPEISDDPMCLICHDEIAQEHILCPNGHEFCSSCLGHWYKHRGAPPTLPCPACTVALDSELNQLPPEYLPDSKLPYHLKSHRRRQRRQVTTARGDRGANDGPPDDFISLNFRAVRERKDTPAGKLLSTAPKRPFMTDLKYALGLNGDPLGFLEASFTIEVYLGAVRSHILVTKREVLRAAMDFLIATESDADLDVTIPQMERIIEGGESQILVEWDNWKSKMGEVSGRSAADE